MSGSERSSGQPFESIAYATQHPTADPRKPGRAGGAAAFPACHVVVSFSPANVTVVVFVSEPRIAHALIGQGTHRFLLSSHGLLGKPDKVETSILLLGFLYFRLTYGCENPYLFEFTNSNTRGEWE